MAMHVNPAALRAIRERTGLTVSGLARLSDISQSHLSNLELGRRGARPPTIKALANALQVPITALLGPRLGDPDSEAAGGHCKDRLFTTARTGRR
jgi:transcriptional regulator with XRE-family HTH domain